MLIGAAVHPAMAQGKELALFNEDGTSVDRLETGHVGYAALSKTPFYLESGGQVSDAGRLFGASGNEATVEGIVRVRSTWPRFHRVRVTKGSLRRDEIEQRFPGLLDMVLREARTTR